MTLSNRPLRLFTVILLAVFSIFAVRVHSQAAQRETAHAAIITVTSETSKPALEDFSWLAGMIQDASTTPTAAQGYLAACTLPPSLASQCLDTILHSLHSTRFEEEVKRELAE